MDWARRNFNALYWFTCAFLLVLLVWRCAVVPLAHDEVATFYFYIQPGSFWPFLSHVDANGHFLMSATAWLSYTLFGSSTLALRLPCVLAFVLLCFAVHKTNGLFQHLLPKLVLSSVFLGAFQFFAFYTLCRGYAMSMSFLLMALYYLVVYVRFYSYKHVLKFALFMQLALSANLTLVFVALLCMAVVAIFQLRHKVLFKISSFLVWLPYLALVCFWVKYAFFLQDQGALYYGGGDSYWEVTFVTLIETVLGKALWIKAVVLLVFLFLVVLFVYRLLKQGLDFLWEDAFALLFVCFLMLVLSFFVLKKWMHVNYPEDRTGLFFYVFFVLSLVYAINHLQTKMRYGMYLIPFAFAAQFLIMVNVRIHPWRIYETIPARFITRLQQEQQASKQPLTIAGHRLREFIFGFMNYNAAIKLSHITSPEALQMNADYAIAYKADKSYYDPYYKELDEENDWGFVLLKRKSPIQKVPLYHLNAPMVWEGNGEYYNACEQLDTTYGGTEPLLAEFTFSVKQCPVPFNAWLVLQIDGDSTGVNNQFVRVPLNLIQHNWNGAKSFTTTLLTGNIPLKVKRMVAYLWNIDKQPIHVTLEQFTLYRLQGEGVSILSKAAI